jgi:hypothetical protein
MEVSGQLYSPAALPLRKEAPVTIGEEDGWASEPVWTLWSKEKSLRPVEKETPAVQPVALPYTD